MSANGLNQQHTNGNASVSAQRKPRSTRRQRTLLLHSLDVLVHLAGAAFLWTVFLWHFTAPAAKLPSARTWGWFYKFLTFWSLTTQCVQYGLALVDCLLKETVRARRFSKFVDDLSCMAFASACAVTVLFYTMQAITKGGVDAVAKPPVWIGYSVHVANSVLAVLDVAVADTRSFGRRAQSMSAVFVMAYAVWIWIVKHRVGEFPYPFMNRVPQPAGFIVTMALALVMYTLIFLAGYRLSTESARICGRATPADRQKLFKKAA